MIVHEEAQGRKANPIQPNAQEDSATALLMRIAYQLERQTAELKQIRRSAATCNRQLSAVHMCMQQLLHLFTIVTQACCSMTSALSELLQRTATADNAVRLQIAISNGRFVMLLLMLLLCACTSWQTVQGKCVAQLKPSGRVPSILRFAAVLLNHRLPAQQKHSSIHGYLRSSYPGCIITTAGRHVAGVFALVLYSLWSWRQRTAAASTRQTASTAALIAAADPLVSALLTSLPVSASSLPLLAVALPPALYEGVVGGMVAALLSGRAAVWVLLWELWLTSCYCNCMRTSLTRQAALQWGRQQQQQQQFYPVIYPCLQRADSKQHSHLVCNSNRQPTGVPHVIMQGDTSSRQQQLVRVSTSGGSKSVPVIPFVAAAQLILPVVMPLVVLWR